MEYIIILFLGFLIGAVGTYLFYIVVPEEKNENYRKLIKDFGDFISLVIIQEKRAQNPDIEGMKYIQKLYEQYFEYEMYK